MWRCVEKVETLGKEKNRGVGTEKGKEEKA